jgi:hypothetical protein
MSTFTCHTPAPPVAHIAINSPKDLLDAGRGMAMYNIKRLVNLLCQGVGLSCLPRKAVPKIILYGRQVISCSKVSLSKAKGIVRGLPVRTPVSNCRIVKTVNCISKFIVAACYPSKSNHNIKLSSLK